MNTILVLAAIALAIELARRVSTRRTASVTRSVPMVRYKTPTRHGCNNPPPPHDLPRPIPPPNPPKAINRTVVHYHR